MYHSITIGSKNTWDDWHIIPTSRPIFAVPKLKEKTLDIPGHNGKLSFSSAIRGYPLFDNREGTFDFIIANPYVVDGVDDYDPEGTIEEISDYLDGSERRAVLEDDPYYYYYGRFYVDSWSTGASYSKVTIAYSVYPYKKALKNTLEEDWLWDTFNFEYGMVDNGKFKNYPVTTSTKTVTYLQEDYGGEPCTPIIHATCGSSGIRITYNNGKTAAKTYTVDNGTDILPGLIFYGPAVKISYRSLSGTGTISLEFTRGEL